MDRRRSRPATWLPAQPRAGPPFGGPSGPAQGGPCDVVSRPTPGGSPAFFGRKPEERTPGRKRFFLPGPTFSGLGGPCGGPPSFFAWPAAHVSHARNGPPPGWAGWEGWVRRREGKHSPKPSPWGEGGPAKPGRMRGRPCTQPFLVEKRRSPDCRLNEVFLLLRWATRSPPHPSPSVTASPQGEASGLWSPTRKSVPN